MGLTPDAEVQAVVEAIFAAAPPAEPLKVGDIEGRRQLVAGLFSHIIPPLPADVVKKDVTIKGNDGNEIVCRLYKKQNPAENGGGIFYLHGGGYIAGSLDMYDGIIGRLVTRTGVPFFAPEYRLAPETQWPGNVDDAHVALLYFFEHATEFGVNAKQIAVMGDSGGGGLAAALVHYNLEKKGPTLAKQILIYPMLDDRNVDVDPMINEVALWKADDNRTGWDALLGSNRGKSDIGPSAAPARMTDATGQPPAYIDTGELDIFRDEDIEYARKFGQAGVSCELHVYPGCIHAFEVLAPQAKISQRAYDNRCQAIENIQPVGS